MFILIQLIWFQKGNEQTLKPIIKRKEENKDYLSKLET